jgi:non-homologous end joining protein Ku
VRRAPYIIEGISKISMPKIYVDKSYFLRYLLYDVFSQAEKAYALFKDAEKGKHSLTTTVIVLFLIKNDLCF